MGLVVGDRLKIVFYSRVGSGSDGANTGVPDLASLVEHPEMTGEYIVQLDGTIFLPLIGKVNAAGQGEESLVTILERKSKAIFHGPTNVSVHLVEREPVYVTGDVPQPGAFKYDPGMVILNAVGLAGLHAAGPDLGARLDVVRESERLQESQIELADLLARRGVLVANRNGRTPTPSQDLVHLVGASDAAARIAAAKGVLDLEADKLASEQKILDENLAMLTQERSSLTQGLSEAEASTKYHAERFNAVAQLHQKGIMTDATYDLSRGELENSRARWSDIRAALTRVEQRILEVAEQKSNSIADTNIAREREINQLEVEIQQAEVLQSTLGPTLVSIGLSGATPTQPHYKIVRHSMKGLHEFDADKFAAVQPGDIVEVIRPSPELGPADVEATRTVGRGKSQ